MNEPTPPYVSPPTGHSPRQVVLGLFILGQLAFLVLSNMFGMYQDAQARLDSPAKDAIDRVLPGYSSQSGHSWKIPDEISTAFRRWGQLTGQDQNWSLFAPGVAKTTGFPALILSWEDDPASAAALARPLTLLNAPDALHATSAAALLQLRVDELHPVPLRIAAPSLAMLTATHPLEAAALALAAHDRAVSVPPAPELFLSDNEPVDPHHFLRVGQFRIRRYECAIIIYSTQRKDETWAAANERWASDIRSHVSEYADQLQAYVKWRVGVYQKRHPERPPPRQVILVERTYKILPPDDQSGAVWDGPLTVPLLRYQPQASWQSTYRPIERYNPVTERFESVSK